MVTKTTKKQETENKRFKFAGKAFWAHVSEVNKLSQKFQVDVSVDDETVKKLQDLGIDVKTSDKDDEGKPENHRGNYVTLKSTYPPKIYDSKGKEVTKKLAIGNGSEVNIATHTYEWKFGRDTGTALGLDAVQIVKLNPYKDSMGDMFDVVDDGYDSSTDDEYQDLDSAEEVEGGERPTRTPKVSKSNPF